MIAAFAEGSGGRVIETGELDRKASDHAIIGTWSVAQRLVPMLERSAKPYWHLDSCFIRPGMRSALLPADPERHAAKPPARTFARARAEDGH